MNLFNENTPITVRIRDVRLLAKINGILKTDPFRYANKNELIVELLTLGVNEKYKTMPPPPNAPAGAMKVPVPDTETMELIGEIKELTFAQANGTMKLGTRVLLWITWIV